MIKNIYVEDITEIKAIVGFWLSFSIDWEDYNDIKLDFLTVGSENDRRID